MTVRPNAPTRRARRLRPGVLLGVLLASGLAAAPARALDISFQATDLADPSPGEDLWRLDYRVAGFDTGVGSSFQVLFDPAAFASLGALAAPSDDWDLLALQPDPRLPDFGRFDALALVAAPSLEGLFSVEAVFTGDGAPGEQPFEVYDPAFDLVETGTTRAIPEPAGALLVGLGLARLARRPAGGRG